MIAGSASPSLSPDSTVSVSRTGRGTPSSANRLWPSAASVGTSSAASSATCHRLHPGRRGASASAPSTSARGIPMSRRRADHPALRRSARKRVCEASANSTIASVACATTASAASPAAAGTRPARCSPKPSARHAIGAVRQTRLSAPDRSATAKSAAATARESVASIPCPSSPLDPSSASVLRRRAPTHHAHPRAARAPIRGGVIDRRARMLTRRPMRAICPGRQRDSA